MKFRHAAAAHAAEIVSSVELQGWAVFQNACAARKKLFRSYPMRFRPALPAPFQLLQR